MQSKLKTEIRQIREQVAEFGADPAQGPLCIEDFMLKPPAALVGTSYTLLRDAGGLLPALLDLPAQIARDVILLLRGIDAASAAGLWQVSAAPVELNRIAQRITGAELDIWQAEHDGDPPPAWASERLDLLEIQRLLAMPWDRPFGALETMRDALQQWDRERMSSDE